jgi:catechol 2,3-dioxygenase-like lactoylglutathione lyase family enzyme
MIKTLAHNGLVVRDLAKTRHFYGAVIGANEVPRPKTFKFDGAWFQFGDSELHFILEKDTTTTAGWAHPGPGAQRGLATHIAFEVDDLAAMQARLKTHGVEIIGPLQRGDGVLQLYVFDPDSYMLEFFQWVAGSEANAPSREAMRQ